jgi:glucosyl-3-phosphoglycerate synthase
LIDEIIVMDDGSTDATASEARRAGALVVDVADVLPEVGTGTGKGEALWKSVYVASGDIVVWCDADIRHFDAGFVTGLVGPLLQSPHIDFVKGFYERPVDDGGGSGGRVTELAARPLIALMFPRLAGIVQPLSGEYAGRRAVLESLPFVQGYGVDLGLLIDVSDACGVDRVAQVDLGERVHRNRTLDELSPQAVSVMQTAFVRADISLPTLPATLLVRPGTEPLRVTHVERPPLVELASYVERTA